VAAQTWLNSGVIPPGYRYALTGPQCDPSQCKAKAQSGSAAGKSVVAAAVVFAVGALLL